MHEVITSIEIEAPPHGVWTTLMDYRACDSTARPGIRSM